MVDFDGDADEKTGYDKNTDFAEEDNLTDTDIKINPDYYIHTALIRAQKCLLKEDIKAGFVSYVVFIEHIETLCVSANKLDVTYHEGVKAFKEKLAGTDQPRDSITNDIKLANEKLRLMMTAVFSNKPIHDGLKTF